MSDDPKHKGKESLSQQKLKLQRLQYLQREYALEAGSKE